MVKKTLQAPLLTNKKDTAAVELPGDIFGVQASNILLAQYVRVFLNNLKRLTGLTKTRSEVVGSTRKIYRQKGTGRARHGAKSAPIFVGGGVAHGPKGMKRTLTLTKKMRRKALFYALSRALSNKAISIIDDELFKTAKKTKEAQAILLKAHKLESKKVLFVTPDNNTTKKLLRNIKELTVIEVCNLNAYLVMNSSHILLTTGALNALTARFLSKKP